MVGNHEISTLSFTGCTSKDSYCKVHKLAKEQYFVANFKSNQNTASVKLEMTANMGTISIPVPNQKTNGCDGGVTCPLVKDKSYTYTLKLNLPAILPNVNANVILKLIGDHGTLMCAKMVGKIVEWILKTPLL